jgi:hypothetical protein
VQLRRGLLDRLDAIVQVEALPPTGCFALERQRDQLVVVLADERTDRATPLRRCLDHGDVTQARE